MVSIINRAGDIKCNTGGRDRGVERDTYPELSGESAYIWGSHDQP